MSDDAWIAIACAVAAVVILVLVVRHKLGDSTGTVGGGGLPHPPKSGNDQS